MEKKRKSTRPMSESIIPKKFISNNSTNMEITTREVEVEVTGNKTGEGHSLPYSPNKILAFSPNSIGPYYVYVQSNNQNIGQLHPAAIGYKLKSNQITGVVETQFSGKNRIKVEFNDPLLANKFISHPILEKEQWKAFIPSNNLYRKGVIKNVPKILTDDIINEELKEDNELFESIESFYRIKKTINDKQIDTEIIVITFIGQLLPENVWLFNNKFRVTPYISRVIQCTKCLLYGHRQAQCKGRLRCNYCGQSHDDCPNKLDPLCFHCGGKHPSTFNHCPEKNRQRDIKKMMAYERLSFYDASRLCPKIKKNMINSYAAVAKNKEFPVLQQSKTPSQNIVRSMSYRKAKTMSESPKPKLLLKNTFPIVNNQFTSHMGNGTALNPRSEQAIESDIDSETLELFTYFIKFIQTHKNNEPVYTTTDDVNDNAMYSSLNSSLEAINTS